MQFIAEKCKLGQALVSALEDLIPEDQNTRHAVVDIYKKIFSDEFKKIKDNLNSINISGQCCDDREYPNSEKKQFFQCLASLNIKPDVYEFNSTSKYVKLEAIESEESHLNGRRAIRRTRTNKIVGQRQKKIKKK